MTTSELPSGAQDLAHAPGTSWLDGAPRGTAELTSALTELDAPALARMAEQLLKEFRGPELKVPAAARVPELPGTTFPGFDPLTGGLPAMLPTTSLPVHAVEGAPYFYGAPAAHPLPSPAGGGGVPQLASLRPAGFDVNAIRADFPILGERVHGKPLVWLDNAATTHKPRAVIQRMVHYYEHEYSNVHRGAHTLAARSTDAYEAAREKVAHFLGASSPKEIVFVRGTTEAINLVANTFGKKCLVPGDEIVLTTLEHHSNIVPWQFLARSVGAHLRVVPVTDRGEIMLGEYGKLLGPRTRLVAIGHVSNALGTVLPVEEMTRMAHRYDARVLIDGAQAVSHFPVNVRALDADFYVLSGHKLFAPSGVGVLYGKKALLDEMPPWQGGGNMIEHVSFEESTFADPPARFEAGTGILAPAVGLGAAVEYLERIGMPNVARHEHELLVHGTDELRKIPGLHLIGTAPEKAAVLSFVLDGHEPIAVGKALDQEGIAVRAGHHCAQPALARYGLTATVRPSLALYNTHAEIEHLARTLRRLVAG